jgi:aldose 1-epimerase
MSRPDADADGYEDEYQYEFGSRREGAAPTEAVVLWHDGGGRAERAMEAWVVPECGSNLCRFAVGGRQVIDFDPVLLARHDYTGTPVLYPTPNRVRDGVFRWRGRSFRQVKRGVTVPEHGLVHGEAWHSGEPMREAESVRLQTWIDFGQGSPLFEAFPFAHRLALEFCLSAEGIRVAYTIRNDGSEELPFGFGLHPYFTKLTGDERTFVSLPAAAVMEATADLLPTGRLIDVDGTSYDLRSPVAIGALDLDHVFTSLAPGAQARVEYRDLGMQVALETSAEFSHLVLYSPRGEPFFCLENQTCSTDAHNLYDRGLLRESGLQIVEPGATHRGFLGYTVRYQ